MHATRLHKAEVGGAVAHQKTGLVSVVPLALVLSTFRSYSHQQFVKTVNNSSINFSLRCSKNVWRLESLDALSRPQRNGVALLPRKGI